MIYLTRRYRFSASHRLFNPQLPAAANEAVYGKCSNPGGHGHNYAVEVTVAGEPEPHTGMVVDVGELDAFVERAILERFDASYLNADACFAERVPTTENLCRVLYRLLRDGFSAAPVSRVRVEETSLNSFEYRGEEGEQG